MPRHDSHDLRRTAVRNLERAGVSRSVAMQLTGHKTEPVYCRYAIVSEGDLGAGLDRLHARGTGARTGAVTGKGGLGGFTARPNVRKSKYLPNMPGWRNWQTHRT
jgi:hypothetical protein